VWAIRNLAHAFSTDGGLAVLYGNIAEEVCIVKTAGVDAAHLTFTGPARIFESQDSAVEANLSASGNPRSTNGLPPLAVTQVVGLTVDQMSKRAWKKPFVGGWLACGRLLGELCITTQWRSAREWRGRFALLT
jgi:hypothetical protein